MVRSIVLVGGGFVIGAIVGHLVPKALARVSCQGVRTILGFVDAPILLFWGLLAASWVYSISSDAVRIESVLAALCLLTFATLFATWALLWGRWDASRRVDDSD